MGPLKWNLDRDREVQVSGPEARAARHTPPKVCAAAQLRAPWEKERIIQTSQGVIRTRGSQLGDVIP